MLKFKHLGTVTALAGLLAAASAYAVPTFEAKTNWQAQRAKRPAPGIANCTGQPAGNDHARADATAWSDGDAAPLSPRAQRVINGGGKTDLDGYTGRCRLADAENNTDEHLNDGMDPTKILELLDDVAAANRQLNEEDEQALLNNEGSSIHVEVDNIDHELHAYIGNGMNRQDLGQLSRLDLQRAEDEGLIVLHFGSEDGRYAPGNKQHGSEIDANGAILGMSTTAAIPEPSTYAMLLAGLGLLVWRRRRNNRA